MKSRIREKISRAEVSIGCWVSLGNAGIGEIFANAGFDWVVIDLEHSVISLERAEQIMRAVELAGSSPLVRLTSNNPDQIKRILDAGAHGIVVPMVNSRGEAEAAVAATRYRPTGFRGVGLARAQGYGAKFEEYKSWQKSSPAVIVQIEHKNAVSNLEEILSVPGVDGFIIGPYDLSCSMGIPGDFDNLEFLETINTIISIGTSTGSLPGMHIVEPNPGELKKSMDRGFKLIAYGVDIRMLDVSARLGMKVFRDNLK